MEYKIREKALPIYYSSMSGATHAPFCSILSDPIKSLPLAKLHYHSVPEIGICVSGSGEYYIGDKIYRYKEGDVQIIRPFVPHYAVSDGKGLTQIVFFTFDIVKLMQLAGMLDPEKIMLMKNIELPLNGIFSPDEYPELTFLVKRILEKSKSDDDYTDMSVAFNIGDFLITSQKYASKQNILPEEEILEREYDRIAPAINRINLNISDSSMLTESELAEACGMGVSNFRRLFAIETGMSPKAFIIKTRLSYAEYLLKNTNMTVLAIAEHVGYSEVAGFNKIFSATFKISPSQYRKKYK
ncbi:MAG: helix-turn-helix domain-containing protein [Clostridia bacterium]|nr:helix-turn-helix domain-containing protein [Clostridia bacterium]